jgi:hypothetical protein
MKLKRHNPEQIIRKLRSAEQLLNQGQAPAPASSDLLQPVMLILASRLHRSILRNACGVFLSHGPISAARSRIGMLFS